MDCWNCQRSINPILQQSINPHSILSEGRNVMPDESGKHESDKEFVARILAGDEKAWAEFVERYTDWVFYKANKWVRREALQSREKKRKLRNLKSEKEYEYSEAALAVYLWLFQQLRNKLRAYTGKGAYENKASASLSTYVWAVLNSNYLFIDYLKWRPGYLPKAIQKCAANEQKIFIALRMNSPVDQIAMELRLSVQEVLEMKDRLLEKLAMAGQQDLLLPCTETELSDDIPEPEANLTEDEQVLLKKVVARYSKSVEQLSSEEIRLLQLFYNEELSAKDILEAYKRIDLDLPVIGKAIKTATFNDVHDSLDRIRAKLLKRFQHACRDLPEAKVTRDTVKTYLEQLGVQLA
jgi:hypothetical protein